MDHNSVTTVVFDIDGILIDNVGFERAVTEYIISKLAEKRRISIEEATKNWCGTLEKNRNHPEWHDYALHCESLGMGSIWKEAHELFRHMLRKFNGADEAITVARKYSNCWAASDATKWVIDFKLSAVGLAKAFDEIISITRWTLNKGQSDYWRKVVELLPNEGSPVIFVENRFDRIEAAQEVIEQCVSVWVCSPDHTEEMGFRQRGVTKNRLRRPVITSTHESLAYTLHGLLAERRHTSSTNT
jgi:FMN phosphatase YigB (HAD superfamily)